MFNQIVVSFYHGLRKQFTFIFITTLFLASCAKKEVIAPSKKFLNTQNNIEYLEINNQQYQKIADIYAANHAKDTNGLEEISSSFDIKISEKRGALVFKFLNINQNLIKGKYYLSSIGFNIAQLSFFDENGVEWSTQYGHQKGSVIEILDVKILSNEPYLRQLSVKVFCQLYNKFGVSMPLNVLTAIKY